MIEAHSGEPHATAATVDGRRTWQQRGLHAIRDFGGDLVSIEG